MGASTIRPFGSALQKRTPQGGVSRFDDLCREMTIGLVVTIP